MQHYVVLGSSPFGLPLDQKLLPQRLKELGYETHCLGKWHLGHFQEEYLPTSRGFDTFYGYLLGESGFYDHFSYERGMWGLDLRNGTKVDRDKMGVYSTELFTDEAVRKIRQHGARSDVVADANNNEAKSVADPLFMIINHQSPHTGNIFKPYEIPSRYLDFVEHINVEERRNHAALVASLDEAVGRVVEACLPVSACTTTSTGVLLDCGSAKPAAEVISRCNPNIEPCLFNIRLDPCEYFDVAEAFPEITKELKEKILDHVSKSRAPQFQPPDPKLDPKFNGGVWGVVLE